MPPRPLIAKDEKDSNDGLDETLPAKAGRRKAVSSACIPCRRRKSKCDGGRPSCSTCQAVYRTDCSYDAEQEARRKPPLRRDNVPQPPPRNPALEVIVSSLQHLPENEAFNLLQSLRMKENIDEIARSLGSTPSIKSEQTSSTESVPLQSQRGSASSLRRPSQASSIHAGSRVSWYRLPQDDDYVEHLLNLYFAWHHPFFVTFSGPHFRKDMQRGRQRYCSALLLHAVLAIACNYSDRPSPYPDLSLEALGDHYFAEAKDLLELADEASLTTIQALTVMGLRETSCGREKSGYRYVGRALRMALEMNLHLSTPPPSDPDHLQLDIEMAKLTFWGVHNAEMMLSLCMGRMSQLAPSAINVDKPANADQLDSIIWQPYEDVNLPVSPNAQHAMHCLLFTKTFSELSQMVNELNLPMYAPQEKVSLRKLQIAHARYQAWYQNLPEVFHLQNTGMPHVIVLHMYYYTCLMHLFRPFFKLDLQAAGLYPRNICQYCANQISALMNALRGMYGLRRVCLAVVGVVSGAGAIHVLNLPEPNSAAQLSQCFGDLYTMSVNHPYAGKCVELLKGLAGKWNIPLQGPLTSTSPQRTSDPQRLSPRSMFPINATLSSDFVANPTTSHTDSTQGHSQSQGQTEGYRDRFDSAYHSTQSYPMYMSGEMGPPPQPQSQQASMQNQNMMWGSFSGQSGYSSGDSGQGSYAHTPDVSMSETGNPMYQYQHQHQHQE